MNKSRRITAVFEKRKQALLASLDVMTEHDECSARPEPPGEQPRQSQRGGGEKSAAGAKCASSDEPKRGGLSDEAIRLLVEFANKPLQPRTQAYKSVSLPPRKGKRAATELESKRFLRMHRMVSKGRGARIQLGEVLPTGVEFLRSLGLPEPVGLPGRGSFPHKVYCQWLAREPREAGFEPTFEMVVGNKVLDVGWRDADGRIIGVEVILTGSLSWNAQQMEKAREVAGLAELIIASDDRAFLKKLEARLIESRGGLWADASPQLTFLFLGECVPV